MKKFKGYAKDMYITMFGVLELKCVKPKVYKEPVYQINFVSDSSNQTKIMHSSLHMVTLRVFPNKSKALHFMIKAERELLKDLEAIKKDCL